MVLEFSGILPIVYFPHETTSKYFLQNSAYDYAHNLSAGSFSTINSAIKYAINSSTIA